MAYNRINTRQRQILRKHYRETKISKKDLIPWASKKFKTDIQRSTISDILSSKWSYLDKNNGKEPGHRNSKSTWPILERCLLDWVLGGLCRGQYTTEEQIIKTGIEIWEALPHEAKINPQTGKDLPEPLWSNGWVDKFKKRHDIVEKVRLSKAISQGEYPQEEMTKIHFIAKDYQRKDVYNVDESGLFWRRGPAKGSMAEESRLCVIFCTNADGSDKLPLHYTGKSMTPWDFTQREFVQKEWTWTSNKTAWMTGELMANWLDMYYKHVGQDRNVLLLMDGYSNHKMAVLENPPPANIRIEFLPNPVSGLQPLRQGIIYEAKLRYIRHLINEQILFYKAVWETESAGVEITDVKPKISLRDAVWWLHDVSKE